MIEVEALTKRYGTITAIDGISFKVEKGEILGFLGPNGAGKTTTMRILTSFMPPSSGKASIAGYDCQIDPMEVKRRTGYLPEQAPLYHDMKVNEFLDFAATVKSLKGEKKRKKIDEVMEQTGIGDVAGRLIGNLSKGYRQRVGLAQALVNDPEVLILDEPTAGLDPKQIVGIRQLIKNLAGHRTVILSTHILPEVSIVCSRVVIINKGKVIAEDTPENLAAKKEKRNLINFIVEGDPRQARDRMLKIGGVIKIEDGKAGKKGEYSFEVETDPEKDLRRELAEAVVNGGCGLLEMKQKTLSLEEIFVDLVTEEEEGQAVE